MRRRVLGKVLAALLLMLLVMLLGYWSNVQDTAMGKAAFLAQQAVRYDEWYSPDSGLPSLLAVLVGVLFVSYELIALVVSRVIAWLSPQSRADRPGDDSG